MVRVRYSFGSRHTGKLTNIKKQRKKYPKIIDEVIRVSDIVLEVLDARYIQETRNLELEKEIKDQGKIVIYVLNKADLVDIKKVKEKLKLKPYVFVSCTKRVGSVKLRDLIKRILKGVELPDKKQRAQVGIVGYPNTGKSSLINFLTGRTSAKTGNQAGFTKGMQKIKLTKEILILDTPGVIPDNQYSMTDKQKITHHAKVGARSYSNIKNPELIIQGLLDNSEDRKKLEKYYKIQTDGNSDILLEEVGKSKGYLKKGGIVAIDRAARTVLRDWQNKVMK